VREAMKAKKAQARIVPSNQLERIFDTLPDGVIACDREGKILWTNAAALKLFEVAAAPGTSYQQFLQHYEMGDEQQRALSLEPWLMSLIIREAASVRKKKPFFYRFLPGGRSTSTFAA